MDIEDIQTIEALCDELGITVEEYFLQAHRNEEINRINEENHYKKHCIEKEKFEEMQRHLEDIKNFWY